MFGKAIRDRRNPAPSRALEIARLGMGGAHGVPRGVAGPGGEKEAQAELSQTLRSVETLSETSCRTPFAKSLSGTLRVVL